MSQRDDFVAPQAWNLQSLWENEENVDSTVAASGATLFGLLLHRSFRSVQNRQMQKRKAEFNIFSVFPFIRRHSNGSTHSLSSHEIPNNIH